MKIDHWIFEAILFNCCRISAKKRRTDQSVLSTKRKQNKTKRRAQVFALNRIRKLCVFKLYRVLLYLFVNSARSLVYPMDMKFALFDSYVWLCMLWFIESFRVFSHFFVFVLLFFFWWVLIWFVAFFLSPSSLVCRRFYFIWWTFHWSLTHTLSLLLLLLWFYIHSIRETAKKVTRNIKLINWIAVRNQSPNSIQMASVCTIQVCIFFTPTKKNDIIKSAHTAQN